MFEKHGDDIAFSIEDDNGQGRDPPRKAAISEVPDLACRLVTNRCGARRHLQQARQPPALRMPLTHNKEMEKSANNIGPSLR
jgi:hypothetical protein